MKASLLKSKSLSRSSSIILILLFFGMNGLCSAQQWNNLERPDSRWFLGNDPTQDVQFGISYLDFEVEVTNGRVDSLSSHSFQWANQSFLFNNHILTANGCALFDSLKTELVRFDEGVGSAYYDEFCTGIPFGLGKQAFLPLTDSLVLFVKEDFVLSSTPGWPVFTKSPSVHSLRLFSDSVLVGNRLEIITGDTLLDETIDFTSDGLGGWWGIARSAVSDRFQVYHFTEDSSYIHSVQSLGPPGFPRERVTTRMRFNPAGTQFVITGSDDGVAFYYFDRGTGQISLRGIISNPDPEFQPYSVTCDVDWSSNGRFVYITDRYNIYQIDTQSSDLEASAVRISEDDPATDNFPYYRISRGPDCRLYIAFPGSAKELHVIDKPNKKGRACELKPAGVNMPGFYFVGIPEFPNYALWAKDRISRGLAPIIDTAVCDSSILAYPYIIWTSTAEVPEAEWSVYPNPVQSGGTLNVIFQTTSIKQEEVYATLYNAAGQAVADLELHGGMTIQEVMLPVLPKGTYTLALGRKGESLGVQQVVVW